MKPENIIEELSKRQLDLDKILKLDEAGQRTILQLYDRLTKCFSGNNGQQFPGGIRVDFTNGSTLYNTLVNNGYLITKRQGTLNDILEKNKNE